MSSQVIDIIASIIQALASVLALFLSVLAIKQTNKSIKNANRAQINIYADFINFFNDPTEYLVIRNFGKSAATIDSINIDPPMSGQSKTYKMEYFHGLVGTSLAPNQSQTYIYSPNIFSHDASQFDERNLTVNISYHDNIDKYNETFHINHVELIKGLSFTKSTTSEPFEKQFAEIAEEYLRKQL